MALFDVVFEGGGAKGSAFVGALQVLKEQGHRTRRLVGTSAGAITATLVAAGYTPEELLGAVNERQPNGEPRFAAFMDRPVRSGFTAAERENNETMDALKAIPIPFPREALIDLMLDNWIYAQLFSFVECGGFFAGLNFLDWLTEKLKAKGMAANETLDSFFAKTGVDLSLVTSDTHDVEMLVLNRITAPACPVIWAVRMSMSIPFVWQEVIWQAEWGQYCGRDKVGNTMVDGGVLSNFPIRLIDEPAPGLMATLIDFNAALNLGLLLDETKPVPNEPDRDAAPLPIAHLRTVQRVARLIDTMMGAPDNDEMRQHQAEICRLPVKGYGTMDFNMPDDRLAALVEGGREAMSAHLASRPDLSAAPKAAIV